MNVLVAPNLPQRQYLPSSPHFKGLAGTASVPSFADSPLPEPKCLCPQEGVSPTSPNGKGGIGETPSTPSTVWAEPFAGDAACSPESCLTPRPCGHTWSRVILQKRRCHSAVQGPGVRRGGLTARPPSSTTRLRTPPGSPALTTGFFFIFPLTHCLVSQSDITLPGAPGLFLLHYLTLISVPPSPFLQGGLLAPGTRPGTHMLPQIPS